MSKRLNAMALLSSCCLLAGLLTACNAPGDAEADLEDQESEAIDATAQPLSGTTKALDPNKELARDWMRWAMELPQTTGPVADTTGEKCAMGQDGPVWFLAGNYGGSVTRECSIPAGKELFFPLINRWCSYPPEWFPTKKSIEDIQPIVLDWYAEQRAHTCSLTLRLDGEDVLAGGFDQMFEDLYVLVPNLFQLYANPEDNYMTQYGIAGGEMPATGDGHYARLKPLPPGDHVLELGGSTCDGDDVWFETSATYYLHVEE